MRARFFLLGVLVGLLLAPANGRETWRRLRDNLAATIDAMLRLAARPREAVGDMSHSNAPLMPTLQ
ncbi:MAG TPA: hypothetical protein VKE41_07765 [Roseiflexaceae bacterium]|nr:hypothetical protein [Roseiflexaceae bacterium]